MDELMEEALEPAEELGQVAGGNTVIVVEAHLGAGGCTPGGRVRSSGQAGCCGSMQLLHAADWQ